MALLMPYLFTAFLGQAQAEVCYGEPRGARNPARVVAKTVFARIPEYQEIKKRGLTKEDPEYWLLLSRANDKFYAAVRTVGEARRYDVILEASTVTFADSLPDVTAQVIAALVR